MHVEHFMTPHPVACDASDTVDKVARQMRDKGVGAVVVLERGKVAGIVTDRDIATTVVAEGLAPDRTPVEDVMTRDPARLTLDDNIFSAIDTMRSANVARRIPVVNEYNELLGIVSISDVAVVAKDLIEAVLLEETHQAMEETHVLTGGKRILRALRSPTKAERLPPEEALRPVTAPTPEGPAPSTGRP